MTILVTGANGQLGTHIRLSSAQSQHRYLFTDVGEGYKLKRSLYA